ncbi:MAG: diphosphomevalonate decarboxylase [Spirochaetia bacterium]|jgi:diphosphomevalonate decarboxylase
MSSWITYRASPSLALLKYWGKLDTGDNLPATPSLAVTLGGLYTDTSVRVSTKDSLSIGGELQEPGRFVAFFECLRSRLGVSKRFEARSTNSFPTAAGLASSSSGFAALAGACVQAAGRELPPEQLSQLARSGSVSAARSVFGGFVLLPAGGRCAHQVFDEGHWPGLRIVVAVTHRGPKPVASREAMRKTSLSSPFYRQWVTESAALLPEALRALEARDLEKLGDLTRASYCMMHAAMLAARPPIVYWLPATLAVIQACQELRRSGTGAWETIDAGPQVKILCRDSDVEAVVARVKESWPGIETLLCFPGAGVSISAGENPVSRDPVP